MQSNFVKSLAKVLFNKETSIRSEDLTDEILRAKESAIGATIFGPIAPNERREFWYQTRHHGLDSWYFHQAKTDARGKGLGEITLHYEVHPNGILRISSSPATPNEFIHGQELENLLTATRMYKDMVVSQLYSSRPFTAKLTV
jgi:hypothetical protein